jgi:hypothetical protein
VLQFDDEGWDKYISRLGGGVIMARRRRASQTNIQPAQMTLTFATPDTVGGAYTIDLSQAASIANRRFYRQGINWAVASVKVYSSRSGTVALYKLPTTWVMANAWKKGFEAWMKAIKESMAESGSTAGRFLDFKVYADSIHHQQGFGSNLLPIASLGIQPSTGEWLPAKVNTDSSALVTGRTFEVKAVGGNFGAGASGLEAVSLIDGYSASRALPSESDPNTPADAIDIDSNTPENWMSAMFSEGTTIDDAVVTQTLEYDKPPYPFEGDGTHTDTQYPGGPNQMQGLEYHDVAQLVSYTGTGAASQIGTQMLKGGNFPCGLMRFVWTPQDAANVVIQVNLVPGSHRGYLCEPMGDM